MWDVGGEATDRSQWKLEGIWTGTRHGGLRENEKGWDMTKAVFYARKQSSGSLCELKYRLILKTKQHYYSFREKSWEGKM